MLDAEVSQLGYDFGLSKELVREYIPEPEREGSLKAVRQINGVTTYLSQMACGEVRHREGVYYAAALAAIDCVTDYRGEAFHGDVISKALRGEYVYPEMELVHYADTHSRGDGVSGALRSVADWQDASLEQFCSDISTERVEAITRGKGGYSALGHLHAVKESPTTEEEDFMLDFGHLMQLLDDYIDCPDDRKEGVSTVFTKGTADRECLLSMISVIESRAVDIWGRSSALDRFFGICRAHATLGRLENTTCLPVKKLVPFYF